MSTAAEHGRHSVLWLSAGRRSLAESSPHGACLLLYRQFLEAGPYEGMHNV